MEVLQSQGVVRKYFATTEKYSVCRFKYRGCEQIAEGKQLQYQSELEARQQQKISKNSMSRYMQIQRELHFRSTHQLMEYYRSGKPL